MKDFDVMLTTIKNTLSEIAKQAALLGNTLQNLAPGDKAGVPNNSVSYLLRIAEVLFAIVTKCEALFTIQPHQNTPHQRGG